MNTSPTKSEKEQIKEIILLCFKHWYYFVISFFICGILGIVYLKITTPIFQVSASVSLRHNESVTGGGNVGGGTSMMSMFGLGKNGENIEDEAHKMGSHGYLRQIIKDLDLNKIYEQPKFGGFIKNNLYIDTTPIILEVDPAIADTLSLAVSFSLDFQSNKTKIKIKAGKEKLGKYEISSFPATINTSYGNFTFRQTSSFEPYVEESSRLKITFISYDNMAQLLQENVTVDFEKKASDIVHLSIQSDNIPHAKMVLTKIIDYYNYEWDQDKQLVYKKSIEFLEERIAQAQVTLNVADSKIAQIKGENNITYLGNDIASYMLMSGELQAQLLDAEIQLNIANIVVEFVQQDKNKYSLIPFNVSEKGLSEAIVRYNEELMKLNEINKANTQSELTLSLNNQIELQRQNLLLSLNNIKQSLQITVDNIKKKDREVNRKLNEVPSLEKVYTEARREQGVQQSVYLFLLEMREEMGLKQANILPKLKVFNQPYAHIKPLSPNKLKIAVVILFFGTFLAFAMIYGLPYANTILKRKKNK